MSTLKANTIQPLTDSDSVKIRTNAQDSLTVDTSGNVTARNSFIGKGTIPVGGIIMWSGLIASIPTGWALCNGSTVNGQVTPDLRDKFIVGATSDSSSAAKTNITGSLTQTGGSKDAVVVSHTHTVNDPEHLHGLYGSNVNVVNDGNAADGALIRGDILLTPETNVTENSKNTAKSTTGITVNSTGSSGTNANLPPYYALAFIMRIA